MKTIRLKTWTRLFVLLLLTTATFLISFNDSVMADIFEFNECVTNTNGTFGGCIGGSYNNYQSCLAGCGIDQNCRQNCANTHQNTSINCNYSWGDSMNSCNSIAVEPIYTGERMCRRQAANIYNRCINDGNDQDYCENEEAAYFQQCLYP